MKIKKLNKTQIVIIAVIAVILLVTIPTGIYCTVKSESPAQLMSDMFTDKDELINKWQGEKAVSAYEFKEDGTYESYISTFSYTGNYTVTGKKLTLTNPGSEGKVVYKYNVKKDQLILTLVEENGKDVKDADDIVFKKVDHINTKSFSDILGDLAKEQQNEETTEK